MGDFADKAKKALDSCRSELENVKFNKLGNLQLPNGFLSSNDFVYVSAHVDNAERMRRLTAVLKRKNDRFVVPDFKRFCTTLETSGYGDLASKLMKRAELSSKTLRECSQSQVDLHRGRSDSKTRRPRSAPRLRNSNPGLPSETLEQLAVRVSELQIMVRQNVIATVESVDVKFTVRFTKFNTGDVTLLSYNFGNESDTPVDQSSECISPRSNLSDSLDGSVFNGYGSPPGTSTPIPGPHSRNNSHSSNHDAEDTVSRFLHEHKKAMLEKMVVKEIVDQLSDKEILPRSIVNVIRKADDNYSANSILWRHAHEQYEFESCLALCETMENAVGFPKMRKLGTQMRKELEFLKYENP